MPNCIHVYNLIITIVSLKQISKYKKNEINTAKNIQIIEIFKLKLLPKKKPQNPIINALNIGNIKINKNIKTKKHKNIKFF
jgi:hypothetical protein